MCSCGIECTPNCSCSCHEIQRTASNKPTVVSESPVSKALNALFLELEFAEDRVKSLEESLEMVLSKPPIELGNTPQVERPAESDLVFEINKATERVERLVHNLKRIRENVTL